MNIQEVLRKHKLWLDGLDGGERAELIHADLSHVVLIGADLRNAKLCHLKLKGTNLKNANLSDATGLVPQWEFLKNNFDFTPEGIIAYKTFGKNYPPPAAWNIEKGSVITENVNFNLTNDCGCGINVATLEWVQKYCEGEIWKVLIRWEWLDGVCVPYNSTGQIRCERAELIGIVSEMD